MFYTMRLAAATAIYERLLFHDLVFMAYVNFDSLTQSMLGRIQHSISTLHLPWYSTIRMAKLLDALQEFIFLWLSHHFALFTERFTRFPVQSLQAL
jgi:hypothetical protein